MNSKDLCLLGLLALAYLYLDPRSDAAGAGQPLALVGGSARRAADPVCPRQAGHPVSRRADGALWCRACDEGFFPRVPELDWMLAGAAA